MEDKMINFIEFINGLVDDEFTGYLGGVRASDYFQQGGCYELAKVIKYFVTSSNILLNSDRNHCCIKYNDNLYDSLGYVDEDSKVNFNEITDEDLNYLEDPTTFGRVEIKFENQQPHIALIKEIGLCNMDNLIDSLNEVEEKSLS